MLVSKINKTIATLLIFHRFRPVTFTGSRDKSAFILTTHGGHLGFYEGGLLKPNPVTW